MDNSLGVVFIGIIPGGVFLGIIPGGAFLGIIPGVVILGIIPGGVFIGRDSEGRAMCRLSGWVEAEDVEVGQGAGAADRRVGEGAVWGLAAKLLGLE